MVTRPEHLAAIRNEILLFKQTKRLKSKSQNGNNDISLDKESKLVICA
jgi:hypothetical protein